MYELRNVLQKHLSLSDLTWLEEHNEALYFMCIGIYIHTICFLIKMKINKLLIIELFLVDVIRM